MSIEERTAAVVLMFDALGRRVGDSSVAMIVQATRRVPLPWLRAGCESIAQSWDESQRNPGAPAIFRAACREAGFAPIACAYDYIDPTPAQVRWWPPAGVPCPPQIAERWCHSPKLDLSIRRALPAGTRLLLTEGA